MASKQVEDICEKAIIELVLDFPIYAQLITRIGWVIVDEPNKDVMGWTNGKAMKSLMQIQFNIQRKVKKLIVM